MPITHENQYHLSSRNLFIIGAFSVAVLTALVGYSYYWNTDNIKKENLNHALSTAMAIWNKDSAFRQWASGHGGVYVEPDERTPRSASLAHLPDRDVVTTDGRELTLMNPAYMMRQMIEESEESYGIKAKITGKVLLNPVNAPDAWQLMALNVFESGEADEIYEQQNIDGQPYLRYMKAMYMTEGCEKCHGVLGFKEGDFRGGVSVSVPLTPLFTAAADTNRAVLITHLVVWVIGLTAIAMFTFFTRRSLVQIDNIVGALQISERKFRGIISSAPDSILIANSSGEIEIANKELERMTGFNSKELIGKKVDLLVPKRFTRHEKHVDRYVTDPMYRSLGSKESLFCVTKDGSEIPVEISLNPIETEEGTFFSATIRDITSSLQAKKESANLEAQLVQSQKMQAVGQLAGGIAHDFNNILHAVLGYSGMAMDKVLKKSDTELEGYLNKIIAAGNRASKLIENLLIFSRTDNAKVSKSILVNDVVEDAVNLLHGIIPSSVEIELDIAANLPRVLINPIHLEQIILNLSINAMHAMDEIGTLNIRVHRLKFSEIQQTIPNTMTGSNCERIDLCFCHDMDIPGSHGGDYLELSIEDAGTGISKQNLQHIFEPFYSTKEVGKGTGMGLSMVHGIMKGVNGYIIVESSEGKGTVFRLLFKACEETILAESSIVEDREFFIAVPNKCILLVDDDAMVLDFMELMLSGQGYEVNPCTNGEEALATLQKSPEKFDLVITDQTMPKMTGIDLCTQIMEIRPDIPIVLCSGYGELIDEIQAKTIGIKSYLKKPISLYQLLQTVSNLLSIKNSG